MTNGTVQCQEVRTFQKTKEEKTWGALEEWSLSPKISRAATRKGSF